MALFGCFAEEAASAVEEGDEKDDEEEEDEEDEKDDAGNPPGGGEMGRDTLFPKAFLIISFFVLKRAIRLFSLARFLAKLSQLLWAEMYFWMACLYL